MSPQIKYWIPASMCGGWVTSSYRYFIVDVVDTVSISGVPVLQLLTSRPTSQTVSHLHGPDNRMIHSDSLIAVSSYLVKLMGVEEVWTGGAEVRITLSL